VSVSDIENYLREARKLAAMTAGDLTVLSHVGPAAYQRQVERCTMYWEVLTSEERALVNKQACQP